MKRVVRLAAPLLAAAILAGCKLNLTADVYSSDVRDAMEGTAGISSPATLAFQVPSVDKCAEHTAKIREIMAGVLKDFTPKGCKRESMDSFLLADTQLPLFNSEEAWRKANSLFGLLLYQNPDRPHIAVAIVLNTQKYGILTSRMKEKFHQTVDLSASKVTLVFNNDERNTSIFAVREVFVNAEPVHGRRDYKLERRHKANIRLSNVATASLAREGFATGFTLKGRDKE